MADKKATIMQQSQVNAGSVIEPVALPFAVSSGDVNILCGSCSSVLIQGMAGDQPAGIVLRCPKCKTLNSL